MRARKTKLWLGLFVAAATFLQYMSILDIQNEPGVPEAFIRAGYWILFAGWLTSLWLLIWYMLDCYRENDIQETIINERRRNRELQDMAFLKAGKRK